MIKLRFTLILGLVGIFAGCGTLQQSDPCAGLDQTAYYQCAAYHEQVRANRVNYFLQQQQQWNSNAYQPRPTTQTDCYSDGLGGVSCQSR